MLAPQWGKRWFSIEGKFLRWYRQEADMNPSGTINLKHVRSIAKVEISGCFTFCVTSEDRNLIMRAMSIMEMNNWIKSLHIHADIARGGSGMNVVSDFNEVPLRATGLLQSKRGTKLRSSLSLQQEIDLNLKKLTEMENELQSQGNCDSRRDNSPHGRRKPSESKYEDEEHNRRYQRQQDKFSADANTSSRRTGRKSNPMYDENSDDGDCDPDHVANGIAVDEISDDMPHIKKSSALYAAKKAMKRIESADSIEDITNTAPVTRTPRRRSSGNHVRDRQFDRDRSQNFTFKGENFPSDETAGTLSSHQQEQQHRTSQQRAEIDPDILTGDSDEDEFDFEGAGASRGVRSNHHQGKHRHQQGSNHNRDHKQQSGCGGGREYQDFEIMSLSTDTADTCNAVGVQQQQHSSRPEANRVQNNENTQQNAAGNKNSSNTGVNGFSSKHKRVPLIESLDSLDSVDLLPSPTTFPVQVAKDSTPSTTSSSSSAAAVVVGDRNRSGNKQSNGSTSNGNSNNSSIINSSKSRAQKDALLESRSSHVRHVGADSGVGGRAQRGPNQPLRSAWEDPY